MRWLSRLYSAARAVVGDGETPDATYADLRAALPSLLAEWLARGVSIPEPSGSKEVTHYSGRLALRLPKSLHA